LDFSAKNASVEKGVIFSRFCADVFYGQPLSGLKTAVAVGSEGVKVHSGESQLFGRDERIVRGTLVGLCYLLLLA